MDVINSAYPNLDEYSQLNKFSDSKLGSDLLKKWGWKGEGFGIGKTEDGIAEPISFQTYLYRQGLGSEMIPFSSYEEDNEPTNDANKQADISKLNDKFKIMKNLRKFLNDYMHSKCQSDLKFEACFSNEERRLIHQEAHYIGLKTQSVGFGEGRYLTIGKKRSPIDILEEINKNSGQFGKYKLVKN